tara:strand:+ start:1871 stop:2128 length:258 start_codon:yes stop_codon:yes gene_type:complete
MKLRESIMKIEKGIPIPDEQKIYKQAVQDRLEIFEKMEIMDSLFFETLRETDKFRSTIYRFHGQGTLASRRYENGWRVWKVKEGE